MISKLIIASGKRAGRAILMKRDKLLIGRAEECDLHGLGRATIKSGMQHPGAPSD